MKQLLFGLGIFFVFFLRTSEGLKCFNCVSHGPFGSVFEKCISTTECESRCQRTRVIGYDEKATNVTLIEQGCFKPLASKPNNCDPSGSEAAFRKLYPTYEFPVVAICEDCMSELCNERDSVIKNPPPDPGPGNPGGHGCSIWRTQATFWAISGLVASIVASKYLTDE